MLGIIQNEINKLPPIMTRQQVLNWYIDINKHRWGATKEITTGELIKLIEKSGRKVKGQSKLAIHITEAEEKEFKSKPRNNIRFTKLPDGEKDKVENMYWNLKMNMSKIAKKYNCSSSTIQARMRDWKIPIRRNKAVIN